MRAAASAAHSRVDLDQSKPAHPCGCASGGRTCRDIGGRRSNDTPVRQERSSILKQHDPVAQQAPTLLEMTSNGARRDAIRCEGIGALWTMQTCLVPRQPL